MYVSIYYMYIHVAIYTRIVVTIHVYTVCFGFVDVFTHHFKYGKILYTEYSCQAMYIVSPSRN